jgi:hypothetical protein
VLVGCVKPPLFNFEIGKPKSQFANFCRLRFWLASAKKGVSQILAVKWLSLVRIGKGWVVSSEHVNDVLKHFGVSCGVIAVRKNNLHKPITSVNMFTQSFTHS